MERKFKALIKEAILEALVEFTNGGAVALSVGGASSSDQSSNAGTPDDSGKGGASEESSGGTPGHNGKPKPDVGVGGFSLR